MFRIRFFRILLPLLLAVLGVVLWMSWNPRSQVHRQTDPTLGSDGPRATNLQVVEFGPNERTGLADAAVVLPEEDGSVRMEGIREVQIEREDGTPLLISAARGNRDGDPGHEVWQFEERVVFRDPDRGLRLTLPMLEVDEVSGEARSAGDIRFSAPNLKGKAATLRYGLRGQTGEMGRPKLNDPDGGRVTADTARLLDGIRDIELVGNVTADRGGRTFRSQFLRLIRDERLRRAIGRGSVSGTWPMEGGAAVQMRAEGVEVRLDPLGDPEFLRVQGDALISRGQESLAATTIEATRQESGDVAWHVVATESVYVQGRFGAAPGLLRAEHVEAGLDASMLLRRATARDRVSFESRDMRAEAVEATFATTGALDEGSIELSGNERRKARLTRGRTRIAALTIVTDPRGQRLEAQDRVEATLLPEAAGSGQRGGGMRLFVTSEAIHFVSDRLVSSDAGNLLVFSGSVRGWQGERNLAAASVVVDQTGHTLEARDTVSTRIPREGDAPSASESDYIQIAAERLDYDDVKGLAVYRDEVRVRLAEGWLEAEQVEVELGDDHAIHEIRASNAVRLEVHRTSEAEMTRPMSGTADRLIYSPLDSTLKLFGDQTPATVRRIGDGGGTTKGRVLTYRLDTGTLDVDSGGQGSGKIVTPES